MIKVGKKKIAASALTFCFFLQQSFCLQVLATNVSGATQVNGVWNVGPTANNGDMGYRKYDSFDVSNGDVLNLIFHNAHNGTDIKTFLNLVDNQVNIQGIVNAVNKNGAFTDGHAVFISPNGMVVGQSGVLNVGSLSILTPDQQSYEKYKSSVAIPSWIRNYESKLGQGTGVVNIQGKVAARDFVKINAADVNITPTAFVATGVNDTSTLVKSASDAIFNQLVNTDNMVSNNSFANDNGAIKIVSYGANGGTNIAGNMKNFGNGNVEITNYGSKGIDVSGRIANANGETLLVNSNGALNVSGEIINQGGKLSLDNNGTGILIASAGKLSNSKGDIFVSNTGSDGIKVEHGGLIVNSTNDVNITNSGKGGIQLKGKVKGWNINVDNKDSDVVIGYNKGLDYIDAGHDVNIKVNDGNVFNYGTKANLIKLDESGQGNLNIEVNNGAIGKEVGPCAGGICTGIGTDARDLTKSVNVSANGGKVRAISTGTDSLVNLASLDANLNVDRIYSDGRVILLADSSAYKAAENFNIVNRATDKTQANVEGKGISIIASGNIGENGNTLTFRQNDADVQIAHDDALGKHVLDYKNNSKYGVDMLAIKDINVKGLNGADNSKVDTNVCAMISRTGDINAEFSGDTYIGEVTAANNINITTRGKNMYIDNLGEVPTYPQDYYGPNGNIAPNKVKVTALDLGTSYPDNPADSTIVIKNGTVNGQGNGRPYHEQDVTLVADNVYAGGYYFNMGNHRDDPDGKSTYVKDPTTNPFKNPNDGEVSIRAKAVRPEDVEAIDENPEDRNYYYGGSSQGDDPNYDGVNNQDGNGTNDPDKQGTEEDDDNLVVPEPDEEPDNADTDNDNDIDTDIDTDIDSDTDLDTDIDSDTDIDTDSDNDTDNDNDTDIDTDTDNDTDNDTDTDIDDEPDYGDTDDDTDTDVDTDTDLDNDTDTDVDSDTDIDTDSDNDTDNDNDTDIDTDTDNDTDNDTDTDIDDEPDYGDTDDDTDTDVDTDTDTDLDNDTDTDMDSDSDNDTDVDNDTDIDSDTDTDVDNDTDVDSDTDIDTDTDIDSDNDTDTDIDEPGDTDSDSDTDVDTDTDLDNDTDTDLDMDTDIDNDTDIDSDIDNDSDSDDDVINNNDNFLGKYLYKQRVVENPINSMDKRQYMRFSTAESSTPVNLAQNDQINSILDVSRGGMAVSHNNSLKVGDVVPVQVQYGDLNIKTDVKIVSATDRRAGTEFTNLDQATKNKILYMNLMLEEQTALRTKDSSVI